MNKKLIIKFIIILLVLNIFSNIIKNINFDKTNKDINIVNEINETNKEISECEKSVFIGDSITEGYNLDKYYNNEYINTGISGNTIIDVINRLEKDLYNHNPDCVILLIGTNDFFFDYNSDDIINNMEELFVNIKENLPDASLYLQSIYPVNKTDFSYHLGGIGKRNNIIINETNKKLELLVEYYDYDYIDVYSHLKDDNGHLKEEYTYDGLHLSDKGYEAVTKVLKNELNID